VTSESRRKQVLESADELVAILRNEFRLIAPEAANLWGKISQHHEQLEDQNQRQSNE
jgi:hypothetical protein